MMTRCGMAAAVLAGVLLVAAPAVASVTLIVATCDSTDESKAKADYVGDCFGDQDEINTAIAALPAVGGVVQLMEGSYDIRAAQALGGIVIGRDNVTLQGVGTATRLRLANGQNTNVIRIVGDGTANILIRDLYIDGNFNNNNLEVRGRYETNGIRAASTAPRSENMRNITVQSTRIERCYRLNVMLEGEGMKVLNNFFGDARSDVVEILTGPGLISGNHVELRDRTAYVLGTDVADGVTISNNTVLVYGSGYVWSVFRFWQGRSQNILSNNQVLNYGHVEMMVELRGTLNIVTGNSFISLTNRSDVVVTGGSVISGNQFQNADIVVRNSSAQWPVLIANNFLVDTTVTGDLTYTTQANNITSP